MFLPCGCIFFFPVWSLSSFPRINNTQDYIYIHYNSVHSCAGCILLYEEEIERPAVLQSATLHKQPDRWLGTGWVLCSCTMPCWLLVCFSQLALHQLVCIILLFLFWPRSSELRAEAAKQVSAVTHASKVVPSLEETCMQFHKSFALCRPLA